MVYTPLATAGPAPLLRLAGAPRVTPVVGPEGGESGIGAALAATADKDSKLSPEDSFCNVVLLMRPRRRLVK